MQLTMLGTGSAFAKKYFNNNALIQVQGYTLLVDCGITAPIALNALNKSPNDLDGILITHLHADHVGGLEEIAFMMKYKFHRKLSLFIAAPLIEALWEHSLKAGMQDSPDMTLDDYFHVVPIVEGKPLSINEHLKIEILQTDHVPGKKSYSIIFNDYMFYSGDIIFNPDLLKQLVYERKCQYILHDCQLQDPPAVHTTINQLLTLPEEIQKHIYLMHYGDEKDSYTNNTGKMTFLEQHKTYRFKL